jgi:hypothetical protein
VLNRFAFRQVRDVGGLAGEGSMDQDVCVSNVQSHGAFRALNALRLDRPMLFRLKSAPLVA